MLFLHFNEMQKAKSLRFIFVSLMDFFFNFFFYIFFQIFKTESLLKLQIHAGFENMGFISMKNWSFDVFCGWQISEDFRLRTTFFVVMKNGMILYDLFIKNLQIYGQITPRFSQLYYFSLPNSQIIDPHFSTVQSYVLLCTETMYSF